MCKISIIIPTYNRAKIVCEAVQSILQQTYSDYEVIVIDDGSTDNTAECIHNLISSSEKIRYIYQQNMGRSAARNEGIKQARGEYISFLDSDDLYLQAKLELQVQAMEEHPDYSMSYTNYLVMDENGVIIEDQGKPDIDLTGEIYPELLYFKGTIITTPSVMVRTRILRNVGNFDEGMHICEDLDLWRRVARQGKVFQIKDPLVVVRYRTNENIDWWEFLKGRRFYYAKAISVDANLEHSFKQSLYSEMYFQYGLVGLRKKKWLFAIYCIFFYCLTNPREALSNLKIYSQRLFSKISTNA